MESFTIHQYLAEIKFEYLQGLFATNDHTEKKTVANHIWIKFHNLL